MYACSPSTSEGGADNSNQTDIEEVATPSTNDDFTWEGYWIKFQMAVANNDKEAIAEMTEFGNLLSRSDFDDYYDIYFSQEMKEIIANTKAADVPLVDDAMEFPEGRVISHEETGYDEEGNEMGSAIMLYFGKKDDAFKLLMFFAAG